MYKAWEIRNKIAKEHNIILDKTIVNSVIKECNGKYHLILMALGDAIDDEKRKNIIIGDEL